jgi:hypothetical protein
MDDIERLADELIGDITGWHPIGWQGAAQHTYTMACDGFHAPGPCPERQQPVWVKFGS